MNEDYITIFAIMPKEIYQTKELSPEDKLIAERLVYLCKKEGYSWITNKSLADMYGIKEDSVSQHITNLKNYGFIKCVYENNTHKKTNRTIYLTENLWNIKPNTGMLDNEQPTGSITGHNNNYKNKFNNNINTINPYSVDENGNEYWNGEKIENKGWDFNNQEDVKKYQELEEMMAEFRGNNNE